MRRTRDKQGRWSALTFLLKSKAKCIIMYASSSGKEKIAPKKIAFSNYNNTTHDFETLIIFYVKTK